MQDRIPLTAEKLRDQVRIWLHSLRSMRILGEQNYKVEWQRVERAYDYLAMLDVAGTPAEPPKPSEVTIGDVIAALQPVDDFLAGQNATEAKATESKPDTSPNDSETLEPQERALALLVKHPEWSDTKIADTIGVSRTTLYKPTWNRYQKAREAMKAGRDEMPRGERDIDGNLEAW